MKILKIQVVCDLLIGAILINLERPLVKISRLRQYLTLNMALTVPDRHICRPTVDN